VPQLPALGLALSILSLVLGLACKYYRGPGQVFVNHWGPASVFYETMFIFALFAVWPYRWAVGRIAVSVLIATCFLECLQTWQPPWLQRIRANLIGRLLLGTTFSWWDMPAYFVGSVLGWACLRRLTSKQSVAD
jgi:hypothetical protein